MAEEPTVRITNIETTDSIVSGIFHTRDIAEANMLRRAILSEIETYAIDIVIFHTNTSPRHDEIIALRLGQLVIDHSRFVPPDDKVFKTHIEIHGPTTVTTDHIPEIPFKFKTPITVLRTGQSIICDVIVKKGIGRDHAKWRCVSKVTMTEVEEGYKITFKEIGMLSGEEIFQQGFDKMYTAAHRPPITLFSRPLVPANLVGEKIP